MPVLDRIHHVLKEKPGERPRRPAPSGTPKARSSAEARPSRVSASTPVTGPTIGRSMVSGVKPPHELQKARHRPPTNSASARSHAKQDHDAAKRRSPSWPSALKKAGEDHRVHPADDPGQGRARAVGASPACGVAMWTIPATVSPRSQPKALAAKTGSCAAQPVSQQAPQPAASAALTMPKAQRGSRHQLLGRRDFRRRFGRGDHDHRQLARGHTARAPWRPSRRRPPSACARASARSASRAKAAAAAPRSAAKAPACHGPAPGSRRSGSPSARHAVGNRMGEKLRRARTAGDRKARAASLRAGMGVSGWVGGRVAGRARGCQRVGRSSRIERLAAQAILSPHARKGRATGWANGGSLPPKPLRILGRRRSCQSPSAMGCIVEPGVEEWRRTGRPAGAGPASRPADQGR